MRSRLTICLPLLAGVAVAEFYCVDYSSADGDPDAWWIPGGYWETMSDASTQCARQYVIVDTGSFQAFVAGAASGGAPQFTAQEIAALKFQAANPSPFNLSISDGALVSGAIVGTWAVAWAARQFVRALGSDGEE